MNKMTLILLLLLMWTMGTTPVKGAKRTHGQCQIDRGAIVKGDPSKKQICLVFTAAEWADGADYILPALKERGIHASFFFTGKFYELYPDIVSRIVKAKHYIGSHSYGHPLYNAWDKPDSTLISRHDFEEDLLKSYALMEQQGIPRKKAYYFLPPFEHHNATIAEWTSQMGLQLVNITKGTSSAADYTIPSMKSYRSSEWIYENVVNYEAKNTLNGHLLCFHFGTHPERKDKFYHKMLPQLLDKLKEKGYRFVTVDKICK